MQSNSPQTEITSRPRRAAAAIGGLGFVAAAALVTLADGRPPNLLEKSDFLWDYYVAGRLLLSGQIRTIYALGAPNPWPPAFSTAVHAIFPGLPASTSYPFVYPPSMACLIAPFAALPPKPALLLFQALSVAAVALAARCFANVTDVGRSAVEIFLFAFGLLFVGEVLIMGQAALLLGLLPLTVGYVQWQRERPLAAGLAWSVLSVKIQLAIPVVLLVAALFVSRIRHGRQALREPVRIGLGLALGAGLLAALPLPVMGLQGYRDWLTVLNQFNLNFANPHGINYAPHLIGSVPELISTSRGELGRALAAAVSMVSLLGAGAALVGLAVRGANRATTKDQMMAVAVVSLLFISPYLRIYDSCVLVLPAWIAVYKLPEGTRAWRLGVGLTAGFLLLLNALFVRIWIHPPPA